MKLKIATAEVFVPDGKSVEEALQRTTHMGIGAHQDDLEIFAADGIIKCFGQKDKWFTGVTVTNGSGSPRDDIYAKYTDEEMQSVRRLEQKKAAYVGEYSAMALLDYTSGAIKDSKNTDPVEDIKALLLAAKPKIIYTHNPADKHDTHVGVMCKVIKALRELPESARPQEFYGVEVWRDLDWMCDSDKKAFDVSAHDNISAALVGIFDSQVCGGKRYDLATAGRRRAHATYAASHGVDTAHQLVYGMDLMPLLKDPNLKITDHMNQYIEKFSKEVNDRVRKIAGY